MTSFYQDASDRQAASCRTARQGIRFAAARRRGGRGCYVRYRTQLLTVMFGIAYNCLFLLY
jgi:hypothetical protein